MKRTINPLNEIRAGTRMELKKPDFPGGALKVIRITEVKDLFNPDKNRYETRAYYEIEVGQEYYDRDGINRDGYLGQIKIKDLKREFKIIV